MKITIGSDHAGFKAKEELKAFLKAQGHEVVVAYDGRTGLDRAREFNPHVILCDIGLPGGMDGYQVARALQAASSRSGFLLLALTGYVQPEDQQRAHEAGFDAHIAKPPDLAALKLLLAAGVGGDRR